MYRQRTSISDRDNYITKQLPENLQSGHDSDFYTRWYAKFGEPQTRTLRADKFLARMKEMIEFE